MNPCFEDETVRLYLGDCLGVLPTVPDASVDAVICDPPYGLAGHRPTVIAEVLNTWLRGDRTYVPAGKGFMSAAWDSFVPPPAVWDHCLRVLKPGGHLVAFAGARTADLMTVSIRLGGFEVRDGLSWIYGNGRPKGTDMARAVDRHRNDHARVVQVTGWLAAARDAAGWTNRHMDQLFGYNGMAGHWTTGGSQAAVPSLAQWARLREALRFDDADILPLVEELNRRVGLPGEAWSQREVIGYGHRIRRPSDIQNAPLGVGPYAITAPASEAARRWHGWNTHLKPAHEPIVLARKPTGSSTTVATVLRHGTGALNVLDAQPTSGRWPTNVLLCHGPECADNQCQPDCPVAEMDRQSGAGHTGASRFFPRFRYQAKAPSSERPRLDDGTAWPTVKPLSLMRWLVRLVTPPGGTVLDPFAGTGTTLEAAAAEGFTAIGIERDQDAADLCIRRMSQRHGGRQP